MNTINHSLMASGVGLLTQECPLIMKVAVIGGLIVSHLAADALPHYHYYKVHSLADIKRTWKGAVFELGLGGAIPLAIGLMANCLGWILLCAIAASLFDFLTAAGLRFFYNLNALAHRWEKEEISFTTIIIWEFAQTIAMIFFLVSVSSF